MFKQSIRINVLSIKAIFILQSQLEKENEMLNESREEYESSLKKQESELNRLKVMAQLVTDVRTQLPTKCITFSVLGVTLYSGCMRCKLSLVLSRDEFEEHYKMADPFLKQCLGLPKSGRNNPLLYCQA